MTSISPPTFDTNAVYSEWNSESDTLIVVFSGFGSLWRDGLKPQVRHFQLAPTLRPFDVNKLFLNDTKRLWYQGGLNGIAANVDEIAGFLDQLARDSGFHRQLYVGGSAGGYAALLFGWLNGIDRVCAIAPRTFLDLDNREKYGDTRALDECEELYSTPQRQEKYFDLEKVFEDEPRPGIFVDVHYSPEDKLDEIHAAHISSCSQVRLHAHPTGGHQLGKTLRNTGQLRSLISKVLGPVDIQLRARNDATR